MVVYVHPAKRFLMARIPIGSGSENVTAMVVYAHPAKSFLVVRIPIGGGSANVIVMVVFAHAAKRFLRDLTIKNLFARCA